MTALDELAREVGASGRTLRRAADRGLIRAHRPTPNKITIDYAEREYVRAHWATIQRLLDALRTEPNVRAAFLFGSYARGTEVAGESDVDVLVALHRDTPRAAWELEERLAQNLEETVQVVPLSEAKRDPAFLLSAVTDARPLVDRVGAWPALKRQTGRLRAEAERERFERRDEIARALSRLES
jgi:predicted nucleotidyltransferase